MVPAGERDALVQPEQAGRSRAVLDRDGDVAHELAEFPGHPSSALATISSKRSGSTSITRPLSSVAMSPHSASERRSPGISPHYQRHDSAFRRCALAF